MLSLIILYFLLQTKMHMGVAYCDQSVKIHRPYSVCILSKPMHAFSLFVFLLFVMSHGGICVGPPWNQRTTGGSST